MELSHDERRRLRSIERQLHDDDPDLARRLNEWPPAPWAAAAFSIPLVAIGTIGLSRRRQRPRITDWMDE